MPVMSKAWLSTRRAGALHLPDVTKTHVNEDLKGSITTVLERTAKVDSGS